MAAIRREGGQYIEWQQYGGRVDNRWNGSNTEGGWTIDGMAAIRREGGWTIDVMAAIRREGGQ